MTAVRLPPPICGLVKRTPPIDLDELQRTAGLTTRADRKYIVDWTTLGELLRAVEISHRVLDISGRRVFRYESIYFDSPALGAFHDHLQGRRRRYKVRSRRYLDTGLTMFELKLKGRRGQTVKHRMPYADDPAAVTEAARGFVVERLAEAYPGMPVPHLAPVLSNRYERMTFVHGPERLTCDFRLDFVASAHGARRGLDPRYVIVESKTSGGLGVADRTLRRLGARPVACSKYCVGVGLLRDDVRINDLRPVIGRYFRPPGGSDGAPGGAIRA